MKNYNDKELNRILAEAENLLSDIQLYETPEEENKRKAKEAEARRQEELKRQEELRKQEELKRREELRKQEELKRQEELQKQQEIQRQEEAANRVTEEQRLEAAQQLAAAERGKTEQQSDVQISKEDINQELLPQKGTLICCILFSVISFIFMEVVTHLSIYRDMDSNMLYPVLFAAGLGCIVVLVTSFLHIKGNTVLYLILLILYGLYCDVQILYHAVVGTFLRLRDMRDGIWILIHNQEATVQGAITVLPWLVFMFLPIILWAVLGRKVIRFERSNWLHRFIVAFAGIIVIVVGILCLDIHGYEAESPYVCFYHFDSETQLEPAGKQLGVTATTGLELLELFR